MVSLAQIRSGAISGSLHSAYEGSRLHGTDTAPGPGSRLRYVSARNWVWIEHGEPLLNSLGGSECCGILGQESDIALHVSARPVAGGGGGGSQELGWEQLAL